MTFTLLDVEHWTFRTLSCGSLLVLEAIQGELRLSTVLNPMEDVHSRAHHLIACPSCALIR